MEWWSGLYVWIMTRPACSPRPALPAQLRYRVIGQMRAGLQRNGRRSRWSFAAAVAVATAVWINLSLSATLATDFDRRAVSAGPPVGQVAEQIRQLLPELSEDEALWEALLLRAGSDIRRYPVLPASPAAHRSSADLDDLLPQGE